jgi:hypothetical protein
MNEERNRKGEDRRWGGRGGTVRERDTEERRGNEIGKTRDERGEVARERDTEEWRGDRRVKRGE